jgi:hypothetical protein
MRRYSFERRRHAKAGHIDVTLALAPRMIGAGNLGDVVVGELLAGAVYQCAELTSVDE